MILKEWLQDYDPSAPLPRFTTVIQSWDTANKSGELNDYSVCTTWGLYDGRYYLLDVFRKRLNYPELKQAVIDHSAQFNPNQVLIEDKGSGTQLIQELQAAHLYGIEPYQPPPQADKIMRANAQTPKFESGRVLLPRTAPWLEEYERELLAFPGTKYDDQVDSTAQALDYLGTKAHTLDVWARLGRGYLK